MFTPETHALLITVEKFGGKGIILREEIGILQMIKEEMLSLVEKAAAASVKRSCASGHIAADVISAGKLANVVPEIGRAGAVPRCCQGKEEVK